MTWRIDPSHTVVGFEVRHMMVTRVRGRFSKFDGALHIDEEDSTRSSVEVTVDVASIDTGEPQRDAHLRSPDFFNVERFPTMTYRSRRVQRHGEGYRVLGNLTVRDVTREVVLEVASHGTATDPYGNLRAGFSAEATLDRKDFGLRWNVPLEAGGVLVGDTVKIVLDVEAIQGAKETTEQVA